MLKKSFVILIYIVVSIRNQDEEVEKAPTTKTFCRERNRPITSDKDDLFNLAEAVLGEKITLQCHFCGETDDGHPKIWYKLDALNDSKQFEVKLDMENNMTFNRVHINAEHTLTIHNVTEDDVGEYFCKGLDDEEVENKYNFFVDVIHASNTIPEKGNLSFWKNYHDEQFAPINVLLVTSSGPDYNYLRRMNVALELVTEWDSDGPCEICGRPKGDGKMQTGGHCRLKITSMSNVTVVANSFHEKTLMRATHLSCRSFTLMKLVPDIINRTQNIPDFVEIKRCDGVCNPDAEGVYKGWKSTKKKGFKYKKTFVLAENAHLTIICPESTLENQVVWKINGRKIKSGVSVVPSSPNIEPRVTVDSFNTLYLYGVTKDEEGNYTCYVDDTRMQQVRVFVVSKAKLLTQAFVRHMMYLAFVLSLTLSGYCAGLVIIWTRRRKFISYKQLRRELKKANKLFDDNDDDDGTDTTDDDKLKVDVESRPRRKRRKRATTSTEISEDTTHDSAENKTTSSHEAASSVGKRSKVTLQSPEASTDKSREVSSRTPTTFKSSNVESSYVSPVSTPEMVVRSIQTNPMKNWNG